MKDMSLRWKMIVPILSCLIIGSAATVLIAGYAARKVVLAEIEHSTMPKLRDTVLTSITSAMSASDVKRNMASFVAEMKQTADLKIVKSPVLDAQYGKGADSDYARDQHTRELEQGIAKFTLEGSTVRAVYPYVARSNAAGKNCLECHQVKEGTVLGAVDIRVSLTDSLSRIRNYQYLFGALGLLGMAFLTGFVYFLAGYIFRPLEALTEKVLEAARSGDALGKIVEQIGEVSSQISQIATAAEQQTSTIHEINNNMQVVADVVRANKEVGKNVLRQVAELASTAKGLQDSTTEFRMV